MEALIHHTLADELLENPGFDARRQRRIQDTLQRNESFFETNRIPGRTPECDASLQAQLMQMLRTNFNQSINGPAKLADGNAECLAYVCCGRGRHVCPSFNDI